MKRFLVFSGDRYYPRGGAEDFKVAFDNYEGAIARAKAEAQARKGWANVFDVETLQTVFSFESEEAF